MGKLTTKIIKDAAAGEKLGDGDGLWIFVSEPGRGKWVLRYQMSYRAREMGLGAYPLVTITKAREAALEARRLAHGGVDPIDDRRKDSSVPSFGEFSKSVAEAQTEGASAGHRLQWANSLAAYAVSIRDKPVTSITTEDVLGVLRPIWLAKPETARRVRNRIERVLDAAKARKLRSGENPAAWRGHLDHLLSKQQRLDRHHAALEYSAVPSFVSKLREMGDVRHSALEFLILTATRLSEAIEATWGEFDLDARLWLIPADRMKAKREHRIPLSERACQILREMEKARRGDRVFNVSPRTILNTVRSMDEKATIHGFRSSFRDWAGDVAHAPREVCEEALAHAVGNQTERAYRRGDALDQRRALMTAWAGFVEGEAGANVVDLNSRRA
jgi:integrase